VSVPPDVVSVIVNGELTSEEKKADGSVPAGRYCGVSGMLVEYPIATDEGIEVEMKNGLPDPEVAVNNVATDAVNE
jgi:hypothetical protein